jgi:Carboxypeptidase regulatory-like domain
MIFPPVSCRPCAMRLPSIPIALLVGLSVAFPSRASAQETVNYASVSGRVTDPQGAVVACAHVTARQTETNVSRAAVTDTEGRFRFAYLRLGPYEIVVRHGGFADSTRRLDLTVGAAFDLLQRADRPVRSVEGPWPIGRRPAPSLRLHRRRQHVDGAGADRVGDAQPRVPGEQHAAGVLGAAVQYHVWRDDDSRHARPPMVDGEFIPRNAGTGSDFFTMSLRLARGFRVAAHVAARGAGEILVSRNSDSLHKSRSAAPGSQGATTEDIRHI